MPSTTIYNFGDVVLVSFPFTNQTATKTRPAVVVSSNAYNSARPDVILMAITGHLSSYPRIGEMVLAEWKKAGLLRASTVKPIVTSLEKDLVIRRLGSLEPKDAQALRNSFQVIFG
jgi:mRNA interferase MazF